MKIFYICENIRIFTARMSKKQQPKPLRKVVFEKCAEASTIGSATIPETERVQLVRDYVHQYNTEKGTQIAAIYCSDGMELRPGSRRVRSGLQRVISEHVAIAERNLTDTAIDTTLQTIRGEFERAQRNTNLIPE